MEDMEKMKLELARLRDENKDLSESREWIRNLASHYLDKYFVMYKKIKSYGLEEKFYD